MCIIMCNVKLWNISIKFCRSTNHFSFFQLIVLVLWNINVYFSLIALINIIIIYLQMSSNHSRQC